MYVFVSREFSNIMNQMFVSNSIYKKNVFRIQIYLSFKIAQEESSQKDAQHFSNFQFLVNKLRIKFAKTSTKNRFQFFF